MRLLNTSTLEVQEFLESRVPEYVILSHTWREEEVTLQDLLSGKATTKKGYAKLTGCCKKAKDDGFAYCWIDTCCIDKTSSAELSEAINSMYQWYRNARICYAYLEDVVQNSEADGVGAFARSKWFTRGWTLQELIAPPIVEFYDASWSDIGTRGSLQHELLEITGINRDVLTGGNPHDYVVAVRLSWAARRETSRLEDRAYCLLGLLGVNMPLLYGEGNRAFRRLQEEMLRVDEDYTLFAWDAFSPTESLLASSPSDFETFTPVSDLVPGLADGSTVFSREDLSKTCFSVLPPPEDYSPPYLTSRGCHLNLPLFRHEERSWYGCLACLERLGCDRLLLCVMLRQVEGSENRFERNWDTMGVDGTLILLPMSALKDFQYASIYVDTSTEDHARSSFTVRQRSCGSPHENPSILRIAISPILRSQILRVLTIRDNVRPFPTEEAHTTGMIAALPGMQSTYYAGKEKDIFFFGFVCKVGLHLVVSATVQADHNPWLTAWVAPSPKNPYSWPMKPSQPTLQLTPQLIPEHDLDRTTLRIHDPTNGEDLGWSIRLSIRPTASSPIAPDTKQYVLAITKEHVAKRTTIA